jgi:protease II
MLLASISPIDNIIPNATSNKFVLCRSGLNDKEVLPYEPVKWILTLRKLNPASQMPKILAMEPDEGHFYSLERGIETRAIDLLIIENNLFSKMM